MIQPITIPRRISQLAFFALTGQWLYVGWTRCPFAVPFVGCASCPLADCWGTWIQWWFIWVLGASVLLVGRAFCGWACPMGLVEEALGSLPRPSFVRRLTEGSAWKRGWPKIDSALRWLRYPALVAVAAIAISESIDVARPYPYVVRSPHTFSLEPIWIALALGGPHYAIRLWVLAAAVVLGLLVLRGWCRYLCPLGALLGLANKISLWRIARDPHGCTGCGRYPRECIQHTVPGTTECVVCADCVQGCPTDSIHMSIRRARRQAAGPAITDADLPETAAGP
ncbi:MAG TPA: 4Fe-4S binding protein [Armatimonadota bacterium]|nr:4Fe-4S binding protein [Armatimonadota bacterium]